MTNDERDQWLRTLTQAVQQLAADVREIKTDLKATIQKQAIAEQTRAGYPPRR